MTQRIDAHQHFWNPKRGDYGWLTPETGPLFRVFGPQELRPLLAEAGIEATVLVQAAPSVAETDYLLGIADTTDFVLGVVGWFDFGHPAGLDDVDRLALHPKIKGFRPMIQDIADPLWMLGARLDPAFKALIAHDLAFDALVRPHHLDALLRLLDRYPELRTVIDHGAKPQIAEGAFDAWATAMARLAAHSGALCKLSGLVTEARHDAWDIGQLKPYVAHLLEVFGPDRLIFGSDWPVCTLASSYRRWVDTAEALTAECTPSQRMAIFGGNAARFYRLAG